MRRPRRAPARRARPLSVGSPWLIATRSAGKLRELRPIFADAGVRVIDLVEAGVAESPDEDAIEIHATFEANALAKARWFFARCGGLDVVADDSGLAVDALGGAPGVRSKRWSGRTDLHGEALDAANNAALLARSQYQAGLTDFRDLLTSENQLLSARNAVVAAEADRASAFVRLTQALGGGWSPAALPIPSNDRLEP
jgi:hypothetical protein